MFDTKQSAAQKKNPTHTKKKEQTSSEVCAISAQALNIFFLKMPITTNYKKINNFLFSF